MIPGSPATLRQLCAGKRARAALLITLFEGPSIGDAGQALKKKIPFPIFEKLAAVQGCPG